MGFTTGLSGAPELPPKKFFGNTDPEFVESRRQALEAWLKEIWRSRPLRTSALFESFLATSQPPVCTVVIEGTH